MYFTFVVFMKQNVNCIIPPAHPPTPVHFTSKRLQISLFGSVCAFLARPFAACFSLVTLLLWPLWRKGVTGNVGSFKLERLDVKLLIKHFFPPSFLLLCIHRESFLLMFAKTERGKQQREEFAKQHGIRQCVLLCSVFRSCHLLQKNKT